MPRVGRPRYWPALDGVRAVAVVAVLAFHANLPLARGGVFGVDVFFVLSGFLITTLLLVEYDERGRFNIPKFYVRRILRLYPALVAMTVFAIVLAVAFNGIGLRTELARAPISLFYLTDWWKGLRQGTTGDIGNMGHTWLLAVEVQFYLVWPWLLLSLLIVVRGRKAAAAITAVAALLAGVYRVVLFERGASFDRVQWPVDVRADALLVGCALALLLSSGIVFHRLHLIRFAGGLGAVVVVAAVVAGSRDPSLLVVGSFTVLSVAIAAFILHLLIAPIPVIEHALTLPWIVHLGRISYGIYLYHYPVFLALPIDPRHARVVNIGILFVDVAITLALAELSYRFIESPFLRMRGRFAYVRSTPDEGPLEQTSPTTVPEAS